MRQTEKKRGPQCEVGAGRRCGLKEREKGDGADGMEEHALKTKALLRRISRGKNLNTLVF